MLTIEFDPALQPQCCEYCGEQKNKFTRLVYWEGSIYAVYYAMFTDVYYVSTLISTGNWSSDALSSERHSFFLRIWSNTENYQVDLGNAKDSPWGEVEIMGRTLDRVEAMAHPNISDVFHITDRILTEDQPIIEYLAQNQQP